MRPPKSYEYNGKFYTIPELSKMFGIGQPTIRYRLSMGWPIEQAVKAKPDKKIGLSNDICKQERRQAGFKD